MNPTKDLTKQAPNSPRQRTGGYVLLSRMTDKARADIAGKIGDYHTGCPVDHLLLDWKGVEYADVRKALEAGSTDAEIVTFLNTHGMPKTPVEIQAWSDGMDKATMHNDPEKGSWFDGECKKLGLNPNKTSNFAWLEADDRASFTK